MGNDWFHEYFINELKAIGRKNASKLSYEVVDSLPPSGEENIIYFVKSDSGSSNNHYDEYAWISSSSTFEKIGSTQIDGSTTQPDWNQNDDTQPDYVKNRPFYTGDPVETVLVEESTISFAEAGEGVYMAVPQLTFAAIVGETYRVYWDGTVYERICREYQVVSFIGNLSIMGEGDDTGEPFLAVINDGILIQICTADTSASHTFSISETVTPVVKIDPKYLYQSDWNQNDVIQPDYIKNRPFYTGDPVETVFVEESTIPFEEGNGGLYMGAFETTFLPIVGETYKVSWDGAVHESTCEEFYESLVIGNLSIAGEGSDTGEPFLFVKEGPKGFAIGTADTSASHTISISGTVTSVVKIDEKYLPDTVATKSDVEDAQTAANNAKTAAANAQTAASAKFQLMRQNTVTTTTTIGTIRNGAGSVPVKGLNIAVGSTIKFTADNNVSGEAVWDSPVKQIYMKNSVGVIDCLLGLELLHDGETYNFTNKTTSSILSNLVIEYEKVIIPKSTYPSRTEGAWLPPYLIANCLYLTKASTNSNSATLYRITVGDSGIIKTVNTSDGTVIQLARTSDIQNVVTEKISNLNKADTAVDGKYVSAVTESNGIINVTRANLPNIPTDDHINELINTALNAIGIAEEGAY